MVSLTNATILRTFRPSRQLLWRRGRKQIALAKGGKKTQQQAGGFFFLDDDSTGSGDDFAGKFAFWQSSSVVRKGFNWKKEAKGQPEEEDEERCEEERSKSPANSHGFAGGINTYSLPTKIRWRGLFFCSDPFQTFSSLHLWVTERKTRQSDLFFQSSWPTNDEYFPNAKKIRQTLHFSQKGLPVKYELRRKGD